jgi:tetratricopeptide (TPR) repeat protein
MNGSIKEDKDKIKKYTQSGISVINKSIDVNPEFADSYILLETLNFNRWQYEQEKMQDIIAATQNAEAEAKKLDSNNPRLVLVTGISHFYTPEAFGGGAKVAIPDFEKSIELFKKRKEKSEIYPDWGYDMALGYMALSLMKRDDEGDIAKAKTYIDDATKINPESGFISEYVMAEYKKSSNGK